MRRSKLAATSAISPAAGSLPAAAMPASHAVWYSSAMRRSVSCSRSCFDWKWKLTMPAVSPASRATLSSVTFDRPCSAIAVIAASTSCSRRWSCGSRERVGRSSIGLSCTNVRLFEEQFYTIK